MLLAQQQHQRRGHRRAANRTTSDSGNSSGTKILWCFCTVVAVLKWMEIVFAITIIAILVPILCISPGHYDYILAVGCFCLSVTLLTLIVYFFRLHVGPLKALPWRQVEIAFNALAVLLYLAAAGLGVYHCVRLFHDKAYTEMARNSRCSSRVSLHAEEWRGRMASITACCIVNAILHIFSAVYSHGILL